jgi:hypothetical protein
MRSAELAAAVFAACHSVRLRPSFRLGRGLRLFPRRHPSGRTRRFAMYC